MNIDVIKQIATQSGLTIIEDGVYGRRWYKSTCGLDLDELLLFVNNLQEYITTHLEEEHE
jgi:hypothetical protein